MQGYKAAQQEEVFDQLLKGVSWSYKSLNTSKRIPMEKLKAQRTIKARESQNVVQSENELNASDKDSVEENDNSESFKDDPTESTQDKEAAYLNMMTDDELQDFPKMTSTPYPKRKLNARNARKISTERSSSSDSDEIFQTKLSVGNGHSLNKEQQNTHSNSPVKKIEQSKERHIQDFKVNNVPIIIQARAYDKNVIATHSDNTKSNDLKTRTERFARGDSINVEASYTDAELSDSYNKHSLENHVEINYKKREQFHKDRGKNEILNELINKINVLSENDPTSTTLQASKEPEDSIVQDFLNGSFDISFYKSNSILPKQNIEASMIPNDIHLGKHKHQTSNDTSKKKQPSTNIKRSRTTRATKVTKTIDRPERAKRVGKTIKQATEDDSKMNLKSKNAKGIQQRQKNTSKNKTRKSTAKKKNGEDGVSYGILSKNSPHKRPRIHKRNSSLVASKKIKEIEELEEYFEKKEVICLDSGTDTSRRLQLEKIESDKSNYNFLSKKNNYCSTTEDTKNNANIYESEFNYHPNLEEISSNASLHSFSYRKPKGNLCLPKYTKQDVTNNTFSDDSKNYLKDTNKKTGHKQLSSHQNRLDYYPRESKILDKDTYYSKSKAATQNLESKQKEMFYSNKNSNKRNSLKTDEIQKSVMKYNVPVTRSKKRTWDSLEKELLGDFDDSCSNNVCASGVFKKTKLTTKPSIKDPDIHTSTNTQQIISSATGNRYDAQYGLNRGKHNFELGLANSTSQYSKASNSGYTKDIVPCYSKSVSIIEKTIAAMNNCTKKFIAPQKNVYQSEQNETFFNAQFDYANTSPEALFQSNVTVMSSKTKHYYKNEIVGYLKSPRNIRSKSHNKKFQNSDDEEQLKEINVLRKSYMATDGQARKLLNNEINRNLVPSSGEKCNPWNKLMLELNLNQGNKEDESQRKILNLQDSKELKCKALTYNKNLNTSPEKNKKRDLKKANFETSKANQYILNAKKNEQKNQAKINNQNIENYKRKEKRISEGIDNEGLFINSIESGNLNSDRVTYNTEINSKPPTNKKIMIKLENETISKKFSQPVRKTREDATKVKRCTESPIFHVQMDDHGKLKLVRTSSNCSTTTNTSEEIIQSRRNNLRVEKNDQNGYKKNGIEKYKKYLRKKMEENSNLINDGNEDHETTPTKKVKGNVAENKTGIQTVRRTLIAQDDEEKYKHLKNGMEEIPTMINHIPEDHDEMIPIQSKKSGGKVSENKTVYQEMRKIIDEDVFSVSSDSESYSDQSKEANGLFHDLFNEA